MNLLEYYYTSYTSDLTQQAISAFYPCPFLSNWHSNFCFKSAAIIMKIKIKIAARLSGSEVPLMASLLRAKLPGIVLPRPTPAAKPNLLRSQPHMMLDVHVRQLMCALYARDTGYLFKEGRDTLEMDGWFG